MKKNAQNEVKLILMRDEEKKTRLVYGHGISDADSTVGDDGKQLKSYKSWKTMLQRCYSPLYHERKPTYIGCTVSEDWLKYSNFKKWYDVNYRNGYQIDKDLLIDGNKTYREEACRFVPQSLNSLLIDSKAIRGDLPQGVSFNKRVGKYQAQCCIPPELNDGAGRTKALGYYTTPEDAEQVYRLFKDGIIKQSANYHYDQGHIGGDLRAALIARTA